MQDPATAHYAKKSIQSVPTPQAPPTTPLSSGPCYRCIMRQGERVYRTHKLNGSLGSCGTAGSNTHDRAHAMAARRRPVTACISLFEVLQVTGDRRLRHVASVGMHIKSNSAALRGINHHVQACRSNENGTSMRRAYVCLQLARGKVLWAGP